MGHNPLEVTLHRHLLHQRPAAVGIPLQAEGPLKTSTRPEQPIRGLNQERSLQGALTLQRLQHRFDGAGDGALPITHRQTVGNRRTLRRPHLPLLGMGHLGRNPQSTPTGGDTIRRLKAGVGTCNPAGQLERTGLGNTAPADHEP